METIIRALAVYFFLLLLFRVSGKRTLSQITTFDLILLLIMSEAVQQAMTSQDFSITNAILLTSTLVAAEAALTVIQRHSKTIDRIVDGTPLVIVEDGKPILHVMKKERIDTSEVMQAARELHGLERMDQIKIAVLERHGGITIIPN